MTTPRSTVAAAALLLCLLGACQHESVEAAPTQDPGRKSADDPDVVRLTAASAQRHGIAIEATAPRVLRRHVTAPARMAFASDRIAHVGTALRGRVAEIATALGSKVAKGDALLAIDSPELGEAQIEFLQRRGKAELLQPRVALAQEEWDRSKALFAESRGIAQGEVRRREAELALAKAAVKEAEMAATAAENRLLLLGMKAGDVVTLATSGTIQPRLVITAPQAGIVTDFDVTRGELIAPDDTLLTIVDTSVLWVQAQVPEARLAQIRVGAEATVRAGGREVQGTVALIAPMLDEATRCGAVRIAVTATDDLRPGMFAEARIALPVDAANGGTLAIAEAAVQTVDGRSVVFVPVAGEANAYAMRPVEIGPPSDGFVPVRAGLAPGERVVTTGSFVLKAQATQSGEGEEK